MNIRDILKKYDEAFELYCDNEEAAISFLEKVVSNIDKELIKTHHIDDTKCKYYASVSNHIENDKIVTKLNIIDIDSNEVQQTFDSNRFEWWSHTIDSKGSFYISNDSLTDFEHSCWAVLSELFGSISLFSTYFQAFLLSNGEVWFPNEKVEEEI